MDVTITTGEIPETTSTTDGQAAAVAVSAPDTAANVVKGDPQVNAINAAFARAQEKLSPTASGEEPAAPEGDSTPDADTATATDPQPAQPETTSPAPPPVSTVTAPGHWDGELQSWFSELPDDTARGRVLEMYKGFQSAFTKGMQGLREKERALGNVAQLAERFGADPRGVLQQLAQEAGVDVWFEQPLPEGEIPQFETAAEMAKWARDEAKRAMLKELHQERAQRDEQVNEQLAQQNLQRELEQAASAYPDFLNHRENVVNALVEHPSLSVEAAYKLATYDGLMKLAQERQALQKQLTSLQAQLKTQKSAAMRPSVGLGNGSAVTTDPGKVPPHELAFQRAQRRIAAARNK